MCAPSNGALDEIVGRLLATGLTDSRGRLYTPKLVRVGVSVHHSVAAVSLERLVAERMERAAQVQNGSQQCTPNDPANRKWHAWSRNGSHAEAACCGAHGEGPGAESATYSRPCNVSARSVLLQHQTRIRRAVHSTGWVCPS